MDGPGTQRKSKQKQRSLRHARTIFRSPQDAGLNAVGPLDASWKTAEMVYSLLCLRHSQQQVREPVTPSSATRVQVITAPLCTHTRVPSHYPTLAGTNFQRTPQREWLDAWLLKSALLLPSPLLLLLDERKKLWWEHQVVTVSRQILHLILRVFVLLDHAPWQLP